MVKIISLSKGKQAIVDDEDFEELNKYKWYVLKDTKNGVLYVVRRIRVNKKNKLIWMHREILKTPSGKMTDHINHNGLDNRKNNLRICNNSQNQRNRGICKKNKSGFIGVHWRKKAKKWCAQITKDKKVIYLGLFTDKIDAAKTFDKKSLELNHDFATLNFITKNREGG